MVPSVQQAKVVANGQSQVLADIYDLVLTFDYESLNTPIKELGKQLKDKLAAVGLKPNHGKTLHIVAHSMGGLVSRSFIEQWEGNQAVQHLIMLGTPNAGSAWAVVQDLATFALAAGLNGLSSVVFPAKVLADLVSLIEKIDVNLDEMHPTKSKFLQELKDCADPQCPYSIIAGNTSLIPQQEEAINRLQAALQRTWRRAIEFPFMKEANDIAVTVKSIVSLPEERSPAAYIQNQVACDHLSYFRHPAGLDALARAVARAFPGYSGPTTPPKTPPPP
jgi:pimeloyl-ACP methyl ester carboxylesterase